jgi:long-chain acyl-CoA synthetase
MSFNLATILRESARIAPDKPLLHLGDQSLTYGGASASPEELIAFARERLAAYKYPREVHVLEDLPKGSTGKILKSELRGR